MKWQVGLYAAAVLIPLAAFAVEVLFIRQLKRLNAYLATGAIGLSFLLSLVGFLRLLLRRGGRGLRRASRRGRTGPGRASTPPARPRAATARRTGPSSGREASTGCSSMRKSAAIAGRPAGRETADLPAGSLHRQPVA